MLNALKAAPSRHVPSVTTGPSQTPYSAVGMVDLFSLRDIRTGDFIPLKTPRPGASSVRLRSGFASAGSLLHPRPAGFPLTSGSLRRKTRNLMAFTP